MRRQQRGRLQILAALALVALVGSACGARWSDDQKAVVEARDALTLEMMMWGLAGSGVADTDRGTTDRGGGEVSPDRTAPGGQQRSPTVDGGENTAGDVVTPDRDADGGRAEALPCTAPSDETGVTDASITIGTITTLSGPIPGFGESSGAAVRSYVAFRNATGGVCGRQIELVAADDGQDNGRYRAILLDQERQVLGIAGGLAGGDAGGHEVATNTGIPIVTTPVDAGYYNVPNVFGMNPGFPDPAAAAHKYRWLVSQGITRAALVYPAVDQTRAEVNLKHRPQMLAAGMDIVLDKPLPLSTLNYDAAAADVDRSGAQYMLFVGETGQNTGMARSLARYDIEHPDYLTGYGVDFIELAGAGAEGSTAWIRSLPIDEAGTNEELATFLEWLGRAAPGIVPDTFAADAWVAAKAFFDGLEALDGPITRAGLIEHLQSVTAYDADGMHGPINLGGKASNGCVIGMRVVGGQWTRMHPSSGFLC